MDDDDDDDDDDDEDDDNNYDDDDRLNRRGTGNKEKRKSNGLVHSYSFDSKLKSG